MGRPASNTRIGPQRIHTVRTRGGNKKYRALRLDGGNFSWASEGNCHFTLFQKFKKISCLFISKFIKNKRYCQKDKNHRCSLQCQQQRIGSYKDFDQEYNCSSGRHSIQTMVRVALCCSFGQKEGNKIGKTNNYFF